MTETLEVPWGRIGAADFVRVFTVPIRSDGPAEVVVIARNSTETRWFQELLGLATAVCLIQGRGPRNGPYYATQGQIALFYGTDAGKIRAGLGQPRSRLGDELANRERHMSATHPGRFPLTESEKAELKRRAREAAAEMDTKYPQGLSGSIYHVLARAGTRLTEAGEDPDPRKYAEAERDLEKVWARLT